MLSDSEDSDSGEQKYSLSINEHYAKAFHYRKEREELQKCMSKCLSTYYCHLTLSRVKEKYGSDPESDLSDDESDSESDTDEDEDGEELTPAVDAAILRTLAKIKRRDPEIYDTEKDVFGEEQQKTELSSSALGKSKSKSQSVKVCRFDVFKKENHT